MNDVEISWPPAYQVRKSKRARNMSLKISHGKGLEVVLPESYDKNKAARFVEKNRAWIERHLPAALASPINEDSDALPSSLQLRAIEQTWAVDYVPSSGRFQIITRPYEELVVVGKVDQEAACKKFLVDWIKKQAEYYLRSWTKRISEEVQLPFNDLSIRGQKTRWGSCDSKKNMTLNYKLIFLPFEVVRYVIVHELCHTVHLDHSRNFWQLVKNFVPDYKKLRHETSKERGYVPGFLD